MNRMIIIIIKMMIIIQIVLSGRIIKQTQNPVNVYRPTSSYPTTIIDFYFSLFSNSSGASYKQFFNIVFPLTDITWTIASNYACGLTLLGSSRTSIFGLDTGLRTGNTHGVTAFCQITELTNGIKHLQVNDNLQYCNQKSQHTL